MYVNSILRGIASRVLSDIIDIPTSYSRCCMLLSRKLFVLLDTPKICPHHEEAVVVLVAAWLITLALKLQTPLNSFSTSTFINSLTR